MFAKYIDEHHIEKQPKVIFDEKVVHANPKEKTLREHGFLPLVETEAPQKEGAFFTFHYETNGKQITMVWTEQEIDHE